MKTFYIHIRYGQHFEDYYIESESIEDACEEAKSQYAEKHNVPEGNYNFINPVA